MDGVDKISFHLAHDLPDIMEGEAILNYTRQQTISQSQWIGLALFSQRGYQNILIIMKHHIHAEVISPS